MGVEEGISYWSDILAVTGTTSTTVLVLLLSTTSVSVKKCYFV